MYINLNKQFTDINETIFSEYFEDANLQQNDVTLVAKEYSRQLWGELIESTANSYFSLSDSNWIVNSDKEWIYNWMEDYNKHDYDRFSFILSNNINIDLDEHVLFFINRDNALKTKWKIFLSHWSDFICIADDGSLIIEMRKNIEQAIIFTSLGESYKILRK